jgi:hypothetical protein
MRFFYYRQFGTEKDLPKEYILSEFSGFDRSMSGFQVFKKDKPIEKGDVRENRKIILKFASILIR